MITVSIYINGKAIFTRSAHRRTARWQNEKGEDAYLLDTNEMVFHNRDAGAVKLAIKMLKTIKEI